MRSIIVALVLLGGVIPAAAAPNCLTLGDTRVLGEDGLPSELATIERDKIRLRAEGINALWVERWQGCIKVTYREDGMLVTEFRNPITLELIPL